MVKKKNKMTVKETERDRDLDQSFEEFADVLAENVREQLKEESEPFECYTQILKSQLYADPKKFCAKFTEGYLALLKELAHQKSSQ